MTTTRTPATMASTPRGQHATVDPTSGTPAVTAVAKAREFWVAQAAGEGQVAQAVVSAMLGIVPEVAADEETRFTYVEDEDDLFDEDDGGEQAGVEAGTPRAHVNKWNAPGAVGFVAVSADETCLARIGIKGGSVRDFAMCGKPRKGPGACSATTHKKTGPGGGLGEGALLAIRTGTASLTPAYFSQPILHLHQIPADLMGGGSWRGWRR